MKLDLLVRTLDGSESFPSTLLLCNLADTKRRNAHLGSTLVDQDIATFDAILRRTAPSSARVARVGGDEWLVLGADLDEPAVVAAICASYVGSDTYRAGWRCKAVSSGREVSHVETVDTTILRSVRFVGTVVATREDLLVLAERLAEAIWRVPIETPARLDEVKPRDEPRWSCVEAYPPKGCACAACGAHDFEWSEGDSGVYSGEGTCKGCGAEVSFSDAGELLTLP